MSEPRDGVALIFVERVRQLAQEGFDDTHDDDHAHGELVDAAVCYAAWIPADGPEPPEAWPFEPSWWKPDREDAVRNLVKAGALIAAEIDRIERFTNRG